MSDDLLGINCIILCVRLQKDSNYCHPKRKKTKHWKENGENWFWVSVFNLNWRKETSLQGQIGQKKMKLQ